MKDRDYQLHAMYHKLMQKKHSGNTCVIWRLNKDQVEYLSQKFDVSPALYSIKTQPFRNLNQLSSLCKDIHFAFKRGKSEIVKPLNFSELTQLKRLGVSVKVAKYQISL